MKQSERNIAKAALAAAALLALASCGRKESVQAHFVAADDFDMEESALVTESKAAKSWSGAGYNGGDSTADAPQSAAAVDGGSAESSAQAWERKLIRTGDVRIQVQSLSEARLAVESWVSALGGYVSNSTENGRTLSMTVRIPAEQFDAAMSQASGMGKLLNKSVASDDVTEQFYDLEGRLSQKRILLERYEAHLRQATRLEDILSVEARINEVMSDIESMQGRMNRLSQQIALSTIHISATLPPKQTEQGFSLPDTRSQFSSLVGNVAGFFNGLLFAILYIVIFGVPLVLIAALFWWLCFGKLGLIKKLFAHLTAKK